MRAGATSVHWKLRSSAREAAANSGAGRTTWHAAIQERRCAPGTVETDNYYQTEQGSGTLRKRAMEQIASVSTERRAAQSPCCEISLMEWIVVPPILRARSAMSSVIANICSDCSIEIGWRFKAISIAHIQLNGIRLRHLTLRDLSKCIVATAWKHPMHSTT
jgi:hypothetical protein